MHNLLHHCIHMYEWMLAASGLQITLVQVKKHEKFKIAHFVSDHRRRYSQQSA